MLNLDPKNMSSEDKSELDALVLETLRMYATDTIYFKDTESRFLWNSLEHARQLGVEDPGLLYGKTDFDYFPREFAQAARDKEIEIMRTGKPILGIEESLEREGRRTEYYLASKYPLFNKDGQIIGTWGMSRNVTDRRNISKELETSLKKVQTLARVDDLTNLYNRTYFYELLEKTIAIYSERDDTTFSLIAIDVDDMKFINDQYGQPHGDEVLRHVAAAMKLNARNTDTCFRVGGDEFMILLQGCDKVHCLGIAKKIAEYVSTNAVDVGDGKKETVTVSLGISSYEKGMDMAELISLADRKLYKSKRNGKNQVSF